jgi:hypothetical protein
MGHNKPNTAKGTRMNFNHPRKAASVDTASAEKSSPRYDNTHMAALTKGSIDNQINTNQNTEAMATDAKVSISIFGRNESTSALKRMDIALFIHFPFYSLAYC